MVNKPPEKKKKCDKVIVYIQTFFILSGGSKKGIWNFKKRQFLKNKIIKYFLMSHITKGKGLITN